MDKNTIGNEDKTLQDLKEDISLDCTGVYCPVPLYETRKKMNELQYGQILKLVADDPSSEVDLKAWSRTTGNEILKLEKDGSRLTYYIKKIQKK
jgi:tRNA 2-thiouridine synthesizing protein A